MDDPKYKRLVKLLVISWVSIVILIFVIFSLGSWQLSQVRDIASQSHVQAVQGPPGLNGVNGKTETIVTYTPGKDGQNATDEQVAAAVDKYMAAHPVQNGKDGKDGTNGVDGQNGAQGNLGAPGLVVFLRQTLLGNWECRYAGDTGWQPLTECQ